MNGNILLCGGVYYKANTKSYSTILGEDILPNTKVFDPGALPN